MTTDDKISAMRRCFLEEAHRSAERDFDQTISLCDSPIERLLLGEMLSQGLAVKFKDPAHALAARDLAKEISPRSEYPAAAFQMWSEACALAIIYAQCPVIAGNLCIRVDFAIRASSAPYLDNNEPHVWIAVECDGHEYHVRTKTQAAKDRSRDRTLTAMGWRAIRFTGSELYRNPSGCIDELESVIAATNMGAK